LRAALPALSGGAPPDDTLIKVLLADAALYQTRLLGHLLDVRRQGDDDPAQKHVEKVHGLLA
jgi:hypothetical protein